MRQGSVLAPLLFSIYANDMSSACNQSYIGEILLYADDILILTGSLMGLQKLFDVVQAELSWLDLRLSYDKTGRPKYASRAEAQSCVSRHYHCRRLRVQVG